MGYYDTMQVCLCGHRITSTLVKNHKDAMAHCSACGASTISECQHCRVPIRGAYISPRGFVLRIPPVPAFCHGCGEPYPWTDARLKAAQELADELGELTEEEKQMLKESLDDLVRDTPRSTVAATRFKRLAAKAGKGAAQGFKDILIEVITEAAKKVIWP